MTALLEARRVSKVFGSGVFHKQRTAALEDFSLAIADDPPSITAIVGESGSGKTTLARLLLGLVDAERGRGLLQGQGSAHPHQRRAAGTSAATSR